MITSGIIVRVVNRPLETRAVDGTFSTGVLARHDDYLVAALASILMADAGTVRNGHAERQVEEVIAEIRTVEA